MSEQCSLGANNQRIIQVWLNSLGKLSEQLNFPLAVINIIYPQTGLFAPMPDLGLQKNEYSPDEKARKTIGKRTKRAKNEQWGE